jgi:hypothetical protein
MIFSLQLSVLCVPLIISITIKGPQKYNKIMQNNFITNKRYSFLSNLFSKLWLVSVLGLSTYAPLSVSGDDKTKCAFETTEINWEIESVTAI